MSQVSVPVVHSLISAIASAFLLSLSDTIEGLLLICAVFSVPIHHCYVGDLLTSHTCESISTVAVITGTGEATRGVGADSISVTVIITTTCKVLLC